MRHKKNLTALVEGALGATADGIAQAFGRMEIAEDEIAKAGAAAFGAFRYLCPSAILAEAPDKLYRAHAAEIVERFLAGEDLRPGTDAECLAAFREVSLRSPLTLAGFATYAHLFERLFPEDFARVPELRAREAWPGQVEEDLGAARRRLAQPDRKVPR